MSDAREGAGRYTVPIMGIHWQELIIILLIVLVLFGPKRLPEVGRSLGNGIREFRDSIGGKNNSSLTEALTVEVEVERADAVAHGDTPADASK